MFCAILCVYHLGTFSPAVLNYILIKKSIDESTFWMPVHGVQPRIAKKPHRPREPNIIKLYQLVGVAVPEGKALTEPPLYATAQLIS